MTDLSLCNSSDFTTQLPRWLEQTVEQNASFELLDQLCCWLRSAPDQDELGLRLRTLLTVLRQHKSLGQQVATMLCHWLCNQRLYPLFISNGILSREGFGREMRTRLYERINPAFKDVNDMRDVFFLLFKDKNDTKWLQDVPVRYWAVLLGLLHRYTGQHERETLQNHLRYEGLFAIKMLSIWVAAEDMDPELMRLEPALLNADSPFVELQQEVSLWSDAQHQGQDFDDSHLQVMFEQSEALIERLRKRSAVQGSSLAMAHLLERLQQTLQRLAELMGVFEANRFLPRRLLLLTGKLASASAEQHSISRLWKQSTKLLTRSITQNTSDHGEHYITRDKKEYFAMAYSAAGGGVIIALMALFKIYLGDWIVDPVWRGIAYGLNYAIGFVIIFMLHFTVATKQPAMTAARFAEAVGNNPQGRTLNMKLAELLVDVIRSQSVAVLGNVTLALSVAAIIAYVYAVYMGIPLLDEHNVAYQLHSIDPFSATYWYAAIAGLWLFCSGIISGYFDNRCNYLNMRMRLREHPALKAIFSENLRYHFADYIHENYGSLMGNLCFGLLLGLTGVVGYLTHLPLDIRHVAFSSANIGYAAVSGHFSFSLFIQSVLLVLSIGLVNLMVSFSLTLWVALRSLDRQIESWAAIIKCVWEIIKQRPLSLFLPLGLDKK